MDADLVKRGSNTARGGFSNERDVAVKFNNWENDVDAQEWLTVMQYDVDEIESVKAIVLRGEKADLNVIIQIKLKDAVDTENIQVKLVSGDANFNQVDKRRVDNYVEAWDIPDDIVKLLKHFDGELKPYRDDVKDERRMFVNEFTNEEQSRLIGWLQENIDLIMMDVLRGRGQFTAEWYLVAHKYDKRWIIRNINAVIKHYLDDRIVRISPRGSIRFGKMLLQRKGGDGGRDTANMLQFKISPLDLFNKDF